MLTGVYVLQQDDEINFISEKSLPYCSVSLHTKMICESMQVVRIMSMRKRTRCGFILSSKNNKSALLRRTLAHFKWSFRSVTRYLWWNDIGNRSKKYNICLCPWAMAPPFACFLLSSFANWRRGCQDVTDATFYDKNAFQYGGSPPGTPHPRSRHPAQDQAPPRSRHPPVNRILDTRLWKYYLAPNFVCGR